MYTITEDVAPNGYNQIAPFYVKISFYSSNKTWKAEACNSNGVVYDSTDTANYHVYNQGADHIIQIEVVNQSGAELPSTGGMGTTILYIIGALLLVGAGVLLVTRKRMAK